MQIYIRGNQKESQCEMEYSKQRRKQSPLVISSFNHVVNHGKEVLTCELEPTCDRKLYVGRTEQTRNLC